jgi:farnesyl-diphosphate farnesyltransferase
MKPGDLGGPLLASVSRSFYLTIRILPARLREPIGLAYLLARASDTIADSAEAPASARLGHLAAFREMLDGPARGDLGTLQRDIRSKHAGERELIARLGECLARLDAQPDFDRREIVAVLGKIVRGQILDLERFTDPGQITALPDASALEVYTYLVAGCVGEFWTRLGLEHVVPYREPHGPITDSALIRLGMRYGQGLQLVNILRDLPADLRTGRCYLPADELRALGADPAALLDSPQLARPVFDRWLTRAESRLEEGRRYLRALVPARLRAGVFLPWHLGIKTLALLREQYPLTSAERVKVPRSTVRAALLLAVPAAFTNLSLGNSRSVQK